GESDPSTIRFDPRNAPRFLRRCAGGSPREVLARLFLLGASVEEDRVRAAVAPVALEEWLGLGRLARADGSCSSPFRITPADGLLVVEDSPYRPSPPADLVMAISSSTVSLAQARVGGPARAALDLGTGCGVLALLAAATAEQVVGTDCNP